MTAYYAKKLSSERLQQCYALASLRVQQYLEAEIQHLLARLEGKHHVLELGCGYGRVVLRLAQPGREVTGIDVSQPSLAMARQLATAHTGCHFAAMDALALSYPAQQFDAVVCVQNGISAFGVDKQALLQEAWRVLQPGGVLLASTYTDSFWPHRLAWFETQAAHGLLGPLDPAASRDGTIVCTDGFRSGRTTSEELQTLCTALGGHCNVYEIDNSSLWCEITKPFLPPRNPNP